ncbi:MAG: tetratricopeptide repeat protein [Phycisphaera sp.]|nr:tetratricopeptide repeat protein [Phycisphaera sp.]
MAVATIDNPPGATRADRLTPALAVGLFVVTFAVFSPVLRCGFVEYDDRSFVTANPMVNGGLTWDGFVWAFTNTKTSGWFPLTWLSHMIDISLWGDNATGHHLTSLLLHAGSASLLFLALRRMTGAVWASCAVAAIFALHPMRVEAVAWVAERKGVLSGFFWMLSLWAYARYAAKPTVGRYVAVAVAMALGLMAKASVVPLPCVLLLLDVWPLRRWRWGGDGSAGDEIRDDAVAFEPASAGRLIAEKLPLVAMSIAVSVTMLVLASVIGERPWLRPWPMDVRLSNIAESYTAYLRETVWPSRLMIPHLFDGTYSTGVVAAEAGMLAIVTALALWLGWRRPARWGFLPVGWLWFLGVTLPTTGIVLQFMDFSWADRYVYLPSIGVAIVIVWGVRALVIDRPVWRRVAAGGAVVALVALSTVTVTQLGYWRSPETLFNHTLALDPDNAVAHTVLAVDLGHNSRWQEALPHYVRAAELKAQDPASAFGCGVALQELGRVDEAIKWFNEANRRAAPAGNAPAHTSLGTLAMRRGDLDEAERCFRAAIAADPTHATAHFNLGLVAVRRGDLPAAAASFAESTRLDPAQPGPWYNLGLTDSRLGKPDDAVDAQRRAVDLDPNNADYLRAYGNALMSVRKHADAADVYDRLLKLDPNNADTRTRLGMALGNSGAIDRALPHLEAATRLAPDNAAYWDNLGTAYRAMRRNDDAAAAFAQALKADPAFDPARRHLDALRAASKPANGAKPSPAP